MARYIDVDNTIINFGFEYEDIPPTQEEFIDFLKRQKVIDAIPVVRCKDCKYRDPEDKKCDHGGLEHQGVPFAVADDYYCADGERRADNG